MKKQLTLLEKAKQSALGNKKHKVISNESIELAVAWASGEISFTQLMFAAELRSTSATYCFIARAFEAYVRSSKVKN